MRNAALLPATTSHHAEGGPAARHNHKSALGLTVHRGSIAGSSAAAPSLCLLGLSHPPLPRHTNPPTPQVVPDQVAEALASLAQEDTR